MAELERLNGLLHEYSPADIVSARKNDEAFANEVFDITTSDDQRYFLKILKSQQPDVITNEVVMQRRLLAAGIATPEYLEITPGNYVGEHTYERFLLSEYIPGETPKTVTPKLIRSFGATLAKLHGCLEGVTIPESDMQWLNPGKVAADIDAYNGEMQPDINKLLKHGSVIFNRGLPIAITHGDLWLSNVFAEDDEITTVFDLETAELTVRIIDLARTYTSLRFNSKYSAEEVLDRLVEGYDSETSKQLSAGELANLNRTIVYVCGACATWHAIHGSRYRDPYIQLGNEAMEKDNVED